MLKGECPGQGLSARCLSLSNPTVRPDLHHKRLDQLVNCFESSWSEGDGKEWSLGINYLMTAYLHVAANKPGAIPRPRGSEYLCTPHQHKQYPEPEVAINLVQIDSKSLMLVHSATESLHHPLVDIGKPVLKCIN